MTVLEALGLKHPDPCTHPDWVLSSIDKIPFFEDSEITGSHILSIAHQLQGGAGPGGCDASHWRDVLLSMVAPVLICVILLRDCVVVFAIPLFPGMVLEH